MSAGLMILSARRVGEKGGGEEGYGEETNLGAHGLVNRSPPDVLGRAVFLDDTLI